MRSLAKPLQIFLWSYVFIYAVSTSLTVTQVDLWWQLTEGARILHTGSLPTGPAVAYGLPATPYFDEYAGYEVVLALLFKWTGFVGLWMLFIDIYLAILFLPGAFSAQKYPAFDFLPTAALLVAVLLIRTRLEQRPELVGALLQVLLMVLLRASSLEKITSRTLAWLFLLFAVWTNTHDTFVFGFFTLGLWIANELWTRAKSAPIADLLRHGAVLGGVTVFALVLHPYGPRRLLFPFLQASDPGATALSPEMWPITYFSTPLEIFVVAVVLMVWRMVTTRGVPLWLIAFSVFSVVIAFKNFRFVDLAAISLLFLYAERGEEKPAADARPVPLFVALPRDLILCLLCLFMMFLDAFNFLSNYNGLRSERRLATHGLRYASDMAEYPVGSEGHRVPVLCGHGMGSYLTFEGHGHFRPLLDSGLSHFSDDSKRYFFFVWYEPEALEAALDHLSVNYVLLDWDTFPWIPTLHRLPDWQFVACSANGMIWKRAPRGPHPLSDSDRQQVADAVATLVNNGTIMGAFAYSTLLDSPSDSLAILAGHNGSPWNEPFFNSLGAWIDALPPGEVQAFLADARCRQCPMLEAMLAAKAGPDVYDKSMAGGPKDPGPWYWKAIEVRELLQKGEREKALSVFNSIPPPVSSTSYYRLQDDVYGLDQRPWLSAYGKWQDWNDTGKNFVEEMSTALNNRISLLEQDPSR